MVKTKKTKNQPIDKKPYSIFYKNDITSINDILQLYLFFNLDQDLVNKILVDATKFLIFNKNIDAKLVTQEFGILFNLNADKSFISISGINLLSSLWIIEVYPLEPEKLINKTSYNNGDFVYKFYTENKNLSINRTKKNDRKSTSNPRNRKISKRTQ